jgi:hypothetical protein
MIDYTSPLFVNIVLYTIYALVGVALLLTGWSVVRSLRLQGKSGGIQHGVHARTIALSTLALLVLTLVATWLLGSKEPLNVNGETYDNTLWLRISDMLIGTTLVLMILAVAIILGTVIYRALHRSTQTE